MQVAFILNEVKNLFFSAPGAKPRKTTEILRCAQNDNGLVRNKQVGDPRTADTASGGLWISPFAADKLCRLQSVPT